MKTAINLRTRTITVCVLMVFLSACAVQNNPLIDIEAQTNRVELKKRWLDHRSRVMKIEQWNIKGKIAVKAGKKGGHASLRWKKQGGALQYIELFGPLGGGRVQINADDTGVRLEDTQGGEWQGDSISSVIEQRLGWPLPFEQLPNWVRGMPAGDDASMEWGDQGRIVRMNDEGWQVSYPEYHTISGSNGEQFTVPRQIELNALPGTLRVYDKKGDYLGEDFFVRLIIKSWQP